ncbi:hypothetical protein Poli38472_010066 [Pythium oligandrum]|uniref:DNA replication ATP-dependent helicase/nuclease n=1 Tax=Pythium oligandrum TaxID=41045 RepID=A0A8K1C8H0_PYTOL|nr:hypothetical protein Poli38472_010066 [Pythium oligandrum]|eukprot:TMW58507.1 hypothetical protein Poli38472_010066 [Pythium oligandrum]
MESGASANASSSTTPPGLGSAGKDDTRVVWKDSPATKQIRGSGTGRLAFQREMQGFVGLLGRASRQASPASVSTTPGSYSAKAKRKMALPLVAPVSISKKGDERPSGGIARQILFSPSDGIDGPQRLERQRSYQRGDSQDELLLLDQLDEQLARDDETPSTTGFSLLTPPPRVPSVVTSTETLTTPTPKKSSVVVEQKLEFESPDFTEESWQRLEQIEYQASQQIAMRERERTTEEGTLSGEDSCATQPLAISQDILPPTPRRRAKLMRSTPSGPSSAPPPPLSSAPSVNQSTPSAVDKRLEFDDEDDESLALMEAAAIAAEQSRAKAGAQGPVAPSFKRFVVLEVDNDAYNRRQHLRLLDDDSEQHVQAELRDDWYETPLEAGDTINLILYEQDQHGFFSQSSSQQQPTQGLSQTIIVDNDHHLVVVHPDILVSPTSVTTSFGCLRRAVIRETLNVSRPTNQKALLGTLKHELFQKALVEGRHDLEFLRSVAPQVVSSHVLELVGSGLSEESAMFEMGKLMEDYQTWLRNISASGVLLNEPPLAPTAGMKVIVQQVLAVEEMLWSIQWGLKGSTDASVEAVFAGANQHDTKSSIVLPLELKTGSKMYGGVEHQGQVILYTMLLNERYQQNCRDGLLMYAPGIETNRISAMAAHIRGLVIARNKYASAMARVKALGGAGSTTSAEQQDSVFPPMLRRRNDCSRCFQVDECVLHHAAVEHGTSESSGLDTLFDEKVGHLEEADRAYFRRWHRLVDLEQQHAEKNLRALWLQSGWKRERDPEGVCVAQLQLVSNEPAPRGASRTTMRVLRFKRDSRGKRDASEVISGSFLDQLRFRVDDRVILSAESLDGKKMLVHITRGRLTGITSDIITMEAFQGVPAIVTRGDSVVGTEYVWRLDKDAIISGLNRAKENLVRLLIGPQPEEIKEGINTQSPLRSDALLMGLTQPTPPQSEPSNVGDVRRRKLIVHLTQPRFRAFRLAELLFERKDPKSTKQAQALMHEYSQLNIDQQRAVLKVLNSLDYALILGMPGTGKTSTIAFTVRVLVFLGFSVLISSYTHSAVDNLLLKLINYDLPMLRIGNAAQVHPLLAPYTLEQGDALSVKDVETRIQQAKVVGCTCLSVNSHVLFSKRRFDFCIVDEATQTTEPVVLGPLRCADTFVLVGDHYQLPPLVVNAQARREGMDMSLFRRLSEAHPEATQQLSYQYRMNSDIMLVANRLVYGDKLKCGSFDVASNQLRLTGLTREMNEWKRRAWPFQVLESTHGVQFLNTDAVPSVSETRELSASVEMPGSSRGKKLENIVEARVVAGLVEVIVAGGVPEAEIAVISPFRSQVGLITRQLRGNGDLVARGVEVSTIDKYQGKDKAVILVSFVRCNQENHVGELLTDWRRINVALTRAKQKLVLVGSRRTLVAGSALFQVLMQLIDEKQWEYRLTENGLPVLEEMTKQVRPLMMKNESYGRRTREPESEADIEVSTLRRGNSDIEGLVPNAMPLRQQRFPDQQRRPQMPPITRDIIGDAYR